MRQTEMLVQGKGSEIDNKRVIQGRAKRKVITQTMILNLVEVAKGKRKDEQIQSYWNTYHCQGKLITDGKRAYGKYCKNRHCTLCCSIRKAIIINTYLPIVQTWAEPNFVTLTVKAVPAALLKQVIDRMIVGFQKIKNKHRKQDQRGKGKKLIGLKSIECNFNPKTKTYNPHLHLIVPDKETAEILIGEWLKYSNNGWTKRAAQDMRKVHNTEAALIEIVKYGSKIFTEPDLKSKQGNKNAKIYVAALDNIFNALKGHRIFERFGFNLPNKRTKGSNLMNINQFEEWEFTPEKHDWINSKTGMALTGYVTPSELELLLNEGVDTELV